MLYNRIQKWQTTQDFYMPAIMELRAERSSETDSSHAESIALHLPSANPSAAGRLVEKEKKLRLAQVDDSLRELRRLLRVTMGLWEYKYTQLGPSQRAGTRARSMISRFQVKVNRCAERYRAARSALLILDPEGTWSQKYLELKPGDVRPPGRGDHEESEGRREISWIWMVRSNDPETASEEEISNSTHVLLYDSFQLLTSGIGLRTEWVKAKARVTRWSEEVALLREEMRRILWFIQWKMKWWMETAQLRTNVRPDVMEGLLAYASKQAAILTQMSRRFADEWYPILVRAGLSAEWPQEYLQGQSEGAVGEVLTGKEIQDDDVLEFEDDLFDD